MTTELPYLTPSEVIERLGAIRASRATVAFDVEGQLWMTCCGFATSPTNAFVIDTLGLKGQPHAAAVWRALIDVLEDPLVTKVCWNAGYERGFLQWAHKIVLRGAADAMFLWAERWPELPKRLKYAASILTRLPCWTEGISFREEDEEAHASGPLLWRYNALDNIATYQLYTHPQLALSGVQRDRYALNLRLIEPFNYASQRGIRYDQEALALLRAEITPQMWEAQAEVDRLAGIEPLAPEAILPAASLALCNKVQMRKALNGYKAREPLLDDQGAPVIKRGKPANHTVLVPPRKLSWTLCLEHANKDCGPILRRLKELAQPGIGIAYGGPEGPIEYPLRPTAAAIAEINSLLERGLNVKSSGESSQVIAVLNRLGLPPVFKPGKRKANPDSHDEHDTSAPSQSKDQEALLKLFLKTGHPITTAILKCTALRGRLQELNRGVGSDGRIRCSTQIIGTETARTSTKAWLDGSGGNLQTVPKEPVNFRILYRADEGHEWWKLDLTGADLWTVACRVASLGDRTMLDDLLAGIRIPSLVGLMMEGYRPSNDRVQVKADCIAYRARLKSSGEGWKDTLWKKASHLTNYGGKPPRIRQGVIEDSYAETGTPIDPGADLCARVQRLYLSRYWGLSRWWSDVGVKVYRTGALEMATGQVREFLSRRPRNGALDDETKREALAAEPQSVTTHIIKIGIDRLWNDPTNWPGAIGEGDPYVQPLIPCVHDEACVQSLTERHDYTASKLAEWFTVPITIGRETVIIPFEAGRGPTWGSCEKVKLPIQPTP